MKRWLCLLLAAGLLFLTGCRQSASEESSMPQEDPPSSKSMEEELLDLLSSQQESRNRLPLFPIPKEEYDSDKIIWYVSSVDLFPKAPRQNLAPVENEITERINDRLRQHGITQKLEFRFICEWGYCDEQGKEILDNQTPTYRVDSYSNEVNRLLDEGAQVDLFFFQGQPRERLADMTPYFQTELGQKLRSGYHENIWKALQDFGKNCFVPNSKAAFGHQISYNVNRNMMEKYGIGEEELKKPLSELEPIFQKVKEGEEKNGGSFYPLSLSDLGMSQCPIAEHYKILLRGQPWIIDLRENRGKVQNLYENQEFMEYFKTLKSYQDQQLIRPSSIDPSRCFLWMDAFGSLEEADSGFVRIPVSDVRIGDELRYISACISQSSQNKEKAFEVLALAMTDPEISNLLVHGLEGVNYRVEGGVAIPGENYRKAYFLGNDAISYPTANQPKEKQAAFLQYEASLKPYDAMSFKADFTPVGKEQVQIDEIVSQYTSNMNLADLWTGQVDDVDQTLQELNQKMKDAGLQKLLDEINRQLDNYYAYLDKSSS